MPRRKPRRYATAAAISARWSLSPACAAAPRRGGRGGGEPIAAITLEHYPEMAQAEISRHVAEAERRWPLMGVTVIHRYGRLEPGDNIVLVVTAATHRQDAFAAAE